MAAIPFGLVLVLLCIRVSSLAVTFPALSSDYLLGFLGSPGPVLANDDDDWPDFFPAYDQIDQVLSFVEKVKSAWMSVPSMSRSLRPFPVYRHRHHYEDVMEFNGTISGTQLLKKTGEEDEDPEEDEETEVKYVRKGEEDDLEESESTEIKYIKKGEEPPKEDDEEEEEEDEDGEEDDEEEEDEDEKSDDPEEPEAKDDEAAATSTAAPFSLNDIKVPMSFLRIEYMIGYAFLGLMYGLGFLVLFQSICVPVAKFFVFISYLWAIYFGIFEPITKTDAMQYIPPLK